MDNAGVCVYRDEKPAIFAPEVTLAAGLSILLFQFQRSERNGDRHHEDPQFPLHWNTPCALRHLRDLQQQQRPDEVALQIGNAGQAIDLGVICQQRLSPQFRHEDVHGLILGNSMDLAYQILTSTGGRKHDFFMLDGSYEHFLYLTNDHQGEVILALLCDPGKTAELDRILLQVLLRGSPDWLLSMTAFHRMAHQSCLAISAICPVSHALTPLSNYPSAPAH